MEIKVESPLEMPAGIEGKTKVNSEGKTAEKSVENRFIPMWER